MIHHNYLSFEEFCILSWIIIRIWSYIASLYVINWYTFNIKSNIVSWNCFLKLFMMHFNWFTVSCNTCWSKSYVHIWFNYSCFNSSNWNSTNSWNFISILNWNSKWLVSRSFRRLERVERFKKCWSFIPWHVRR